MDKIAKLYLPYLYKSSDPFKATYIIKTRLPDLYTEILKLDPDIDDYAQAGTWVSKHIYTIMRHLILFENHSPITLYRGTKSNIRKPLHEIGESRYFYLTPDRDYALLYSDGKSANVVKYTIDTSRLLDLRSLGVKEMTFSEICREFHKVSGSVFPSALEEEVVFTRRTRMAFWTYLRHDKNLLIKKRLIHQYDGIIMLEDRDDITYESYVLFNSDPIDI